MKTELKKLIALFRLSLSLLLIFGSSCHKIRDDPSPALRPPSVPLVVHDPYFSIWSPADRLNERETVHWTGSNHPLHSILRIDGVSYRVMANQPSFAEPLKQIAVRVYPTRTIYQFQNEMVRLELIFTTPALAYNPDVLSRPVTYVSWKIGSVDRKKHDVQVYFDCGADLAVNDPEQLVQWDVPPVRGLTAIRLGSSDQPVLAKKGDKLCIDWGYAYVAIPETQKADMKVGSRKELVKSFISDGIVSAPGRLPQPQNVKDHELTIGTSWNLGHIESTEKTSMVLLAYDDIYAIRYFDEFLPAWWKRDGMSMEHLLALAMDDYPRLSEECAVFDRELTADLETAGGIRYAAVSALAYRQCLAAHKLVADKNGKPLMFPKENFSNGCIATVDVIYPASPFFFLFSKELTKATLQPIFAYASSSRWKFPFAPHDLGTYPHATGQVYGGGEKTAWNQMPVEETGNMLIMTAVLAKMEGNASFAVTYWSLLKKWSDYLLSKGLDPENQLCTDDFAGHLAHNVNLSAKAIIALGCYAMLCEMTGKKKEADSIRKEAQSMAQQWSKMADDGDHTRLSFDLPGSWSQKYNLVWDEILGLDLFPDEIIHREIEFYKSRQAEFGLPLDNRERYTKNDWITWTATLADRKEDFQTLFDPVYHFTNQTPQRVPLSDWYITDNANRVGFQARSVVGGLYIRALKNKGLWNKWLNKGTDVDGPWAPIKLTPSEI